MSKPNKFLLPVILLIVLSGIIVIFRSFLSRYVIEPVAMFIWAVWRLISSVDQDTYWFVLIALCSALILYLIFWRRDNSPASAYNKLSKPPGRFKYWEKLIREAAVSENERKSLQKSLSSLATTVAALSLSNGTLQSANTNAMLERSLSSAAYRFLFPPTAKNGKPSLSSQRVLLEFTPKLFRRWVSKTIYKENIIIDEILRWMEKELEINNER